jgi:Fanconi anemia group M protein
MRLPFDRRCMTPITLRRGCTQVRLHNTLFALDCANRGPQTGNFEYREYQFQMVQSGLFHNTLVCLPTGLGKTFIAATIIFNFYRWFPEGMRGL